MRPALLFLGRDRLAAAGSVETGPLSAGWFFHRFWATLPIARNTSLRGVMAAMAAVLLIGLAPVVEAATKTSVISGNWNNGAVWSPPGAPGGGDTIIIATGTSVKINVNASITDVTIQAGGALTGDGVAGRVFQMGKGGGEDLTNNGLIDFSGANSLQLKLNADAQWGGTGGTWNFSTIDLNGHKLLFSVGTSFTVNLSGAGNPFVNNSKGVNIASGGGITPNPNITFNYNGTAAQVLAIAAQKVTYGNITINNTAGVTASIALTATILLGNITVATGTFNDGGFAIAGNASKTFLVQNGANFNITRAAGMVTGFGTKTFQPTSTVNYALNGAQPVSAETYGHLTLSGGNTKTPAAGTTTIAGNFTLATSVTYAGTTNNPIVNLQGNFSNSGTFNSGTGLFSFNGSSAQSLTGATTFSNLRLNNSTGLTINNNVTVATSLNLTAGVLTTGANKVITSANCSAPSVTRTSGWVAGFLQKRIPTGTTSCTFEIGGPTIYRPINTTFTGVTTAGDVTGWVSQSAGDHPNIATSGIDSSFSVNRYWNLANSGVTPVNYSATFNFVSGDLDAGVDTSTFTIQRWVPSTWTAATVGTLTATSSQATGLTAFGDFAIGGPKFVLGNFLISASTTASSCLPLAVTITARTASNVTDTTYTGTVNITTSTNHGNWSNNTSNGTLTPGAADSGAATYTFVLADKGSIVLNLSNVHAESLTITVRDNSAGIVSTSASITFSDNAFQIIQDAVQVAGRNQAMTVQLMKRTGGAGGTCGVATTYAGAKNLDAWISLDASDPGGAVPKIGALSLPTTAPASNAASNNLSLTFTLGVATFNLSTSDVGKYVLYIRDDTHLFVATDFSGNTNTITTRPFGLGFTAIKQAAVNNPGGTAAAGAKFIAAGDTFEVTVSGYLWSSTDDGDNDGVPTAGADLTDNGVTPKFAWLTVLARSSFTPATGVAGTVGGTTSIAKAAFSGGGATVSDLIYSEVGSVTLSATATNFLNTPGVTVSGASPNIGRFYPDRFVLVSGSTVSAACGGVSGFTYMDQPGNSVAFTIEARNKADAKTSNYDPSLAYNFTGTLSMVAEDSDNATDLSARLSPTPSSWVAGAYTVSTPTLTFNRPAGAPDGPFESLQLGVTASNTDGTVLLAPDMNPATAGDCVAAANCIAVKLNGAVTTKVRFGRMKMANVFGTTLLDLPLSLATEYYNGGYFVTNSLDDCTTLLASDIRFDFVAGQPLAACQTHISPAGAITFTGGKAPSAMLSLVLTKPVPANNGAVDLTVNLGAAAAGNTCTSSATGVAATTANKTWLRGNWSGGTYTLNPTARATFGIFKNADQFLYFREIY